MKLFLVFALLAACSSDTVSSDEQAKQAYVGLDKSVGKSITLGFAGFNAATSANIPSQMTTGDTTGMLVIAGQVDQGASANKTMRLTQAMVMYSDGKITVDGKDLNITYNTSTDTTMQPALQMDLMGIPTGTISGTLSGTYTVGGDLKGSVTLDLTFNGMLMSGPNMTVVRVPNSTTVSGTAKSGDGTYNVMVTL